MLDKLKGLASEILELEDKIEIEEKELDIKEKNGKNVIKDKRILKKTKSLLSDSEEYLTSNVVWTNSVGSYATMTINGGE